MDRHQTVERAVGLAVVLVLTNGCEGPQPSVGGPEVAARPPAKAATARGTPGETVLLNGAEARRQATAFINRELRGHTSRGPTGDVAWRPVSAMTWHSVIYNYRSQRIELRMGGAGGWQASVTMGPQGDTPKVEHVEFAWD
ncbi:MAG TPA: hypothetical protein DCE55_27560 [Planctomycetaceae bacterium]|nr:hypothetical protein [Planctomycetaceae bacterium]